MTTAVAKLGILFTSEMARAVFADEKTQTRRLVKALTYLTHQKRNKP